MYERPWIHMPPAGSELLNLVRKDPTTGAESSTPMLIKKRVLLTGDSLTDARVLFDNMANEPYVSIEFDRKGRTHFWENHRR